MATPPQTPKPDEPQQGQGTIPGLTFEHGRLVTFRSKHVNPPPQLYFTPDDHIGFAWLSRVAGAGLRISGRILQPNGRITVFEQNLVDTNFGSWKFGDFGLTEGFLLTLTVDPTNVNVQRGQLYAQIYVENAMNGRGGFLAGYVDDAHSLIWPGGAQEDPLSGMGAIVRTFPANPAPGAGFTYTVPKNTAVDLRSIRFHFAASAVVATRVAQIEYVDSGGAVLGVVWSGLTVAASQSYNFTFAKGVADNPGTALAAEPHCYLPDIRLKHDDTIRIVISSEDAADQLSAIALATEEWILDASF